jgi:hypothetical protein
MLLLTMKWILWLCYSHILKGSDFSSRGFPVTFWSFFLLFSLAPQSNEHQGRLILEVFRSHTMTHHSQWDSSGRMIGPSQRHLPVNTQHSQDINIHVHGGIFFVFSCTLYLFLSWLSYVLPFVFTYNTKHKQPCPRRDSNPQRQEAMGRRPSPLGSAIFIV